MNESSLKSLGPILACLCACAASGETTVNNQPHTVLVAPVTSPDRSGGIAIGLVRTEGATVIANEQGGQVAVLLVDVGDRVAKGQVLAELDARVAQLRLRQVEAEARQADAAADLRARHARRTAALHAEASATDAELEVARSEASAAEATRDAANAALATARHHATQCVLRAPVAGVIAERTARLGAVLAPGEAAFAIEILDARRIDAVLPESSARQLQPGARLAFRYPGGTGEARLTGISIRSTGAGSGRKAVLTVISGAPAPGMAVELAVPSDTGVGKGVCVPLTAVRQQRSDSRSVLVVGDDNRLRVVPVSLVAIMGSSALVDGRLTPGDLVVASGGEFLEPGLLVRPHRSRR